MDGIPPLFPSWQQQHQKEEIAPGEDDGILYDEMKEHHKKKKVSLSAV